MKKILYNFIVNKEHHKYRHEVDWDLSAYFVELDKEYQDHVIARQAYTV